MYDNDVLCCMVDCDDKQENDEEDVDHDGDVDCGEDGGGEGWWLGYQYGAWIWSITHSGIPEHIDRCGVKIVTH